MADSKKKKESEIPIIKEQEQIENLLKKYKEKEKTEEPPKERFDFKTREFKEFERAYFEAQVPRTFFEKACRFAGNHLKVGIKKEDERKIEDILYFTGINASPQSVISLSVLALLIFLIISGASIFISPFLAVMFLLTGVLVFIGVQRYPKYLQKIRTVEVLNEMPLAITYLVIFMRSSPELEGAVRFAANHLRGPLGRDLRGMIWKLENRTYLDMDDAILHFEQKWAAKNKAFAESLELIRNSQKIGYEPDRLKNLDEAVSVMLKGNLATMKSFARSLRMPVLVLYMIGVVLPVMGLVIAPVITTFLSGGMSAKALAFVYDIALTIIVYFTIESILSKRPGAFSTPDISKYPGLPPDGYIKTGKHLIPLKYISLLVFIVIGFPGMLLFINQQPPGYDFLRLIRSVTLILGASLAIGIYELGNSLKKLKIRNRIKDIENGLGEALYLLSERVSTGVPVETAISESADEIKSSELRGFFNKVSLNMKNLGVPLDKAIFDPNYGAILYYPSGILHTVLEVMIESSKKGLNEVAMSLRTVSYFMKNLSEVREEINELIGKTVSSMKFQAQFLTSFIAGIIISLDTLLVKILSELGTKIESFTLPSEVSTTAVTSVFKGSMFNIASVIPVEYLQIIVGIYLIEVTILLSMLINGILNGHDKVYGRYTIGTNLLISTMLYIILIVFGTIIFTGFTIGI